MIKLDIGSGGDKRKGFISVDLYTSQADVKASMDNLPYDEGTVDEIYSSHALEHMGKFEVPKVLREWFRVLKPSGTLEVRVPDLAWCVQHWLKHQSSTGWELDIIFGNQNHAGEFHKTGFTSYTLMRYVQNAGFTIVDLTRIKTHGQETLKLIARK